MRLFCHALFKYSLLGLPASALMLQSTEVHAQNVQQTYKGIVTNQKGEPVSGASVLVKGTQSGTTTDANGLFTIKAAPGATLVVSSVGFSSQEAPVRTGNLAFQLNDASGNLNEVVVVGYGSQRKKDLTGSVAVVDVADAKKSATYDVAKMLQGQAPGISVHGSGEPGGFVQIKIRGISSLTNNNPLFVIDGVPVDAPFDFNPNDIESIQVLKDASAGAIYGSRASGGVVLITTKKGKSGPVRINVNSYAGAQQVPRRLSVTDRLGYQKITSAAEVNAGLAVAPGNDPGSPSYISHVNTDWQKEAFKTGIIQDHNVSFAGGNDNATYNVSLGYFDQTSTYKGPQKYNRYTFNANFQGKKGILSYGGKFNYTQSHKVNPYNGTQSKAVFGGAVTNVVTAIPTMPVYDPKRLRGFGGADNATQRAITMNVIGMNALLEDESDRNRMLGNFWAELELLKNLKFRTNLSYDRTDYKNFHFEPTYDLGWYYLNVQSYMFEGRGFGNTALMENTLSYKLNFSRHNIDLLAGATYQKNYGEGIAASAVGMNEPYFMTFNAVADPAAKGIGSSSGTSVLESFLGRVNYNYDERYLLTVNFRRDGSSRFSPQNIYGNFGSVAGAWNVHNEKFMHLPAAISSLKLRGGYGTVGNQNIDDYLYQSYINPNASYVFNNALVPGATTVSLVDPAIKWESKATANAAVDLGLFRNRLNVTVEYFNNKTTDLLARIPIPVSVGSFPASLLTNAASLRNAGVEFSATYNGNLNGLRYSINANAHTLKNTVLKLGGRDLPIYGVASKTEVGRSVGEIYAFRTEGIFQSADEIAKHAFQNALTAPGDVKFVDINGDNKITDADRVYQGSAIPTLYYGSNIELGYKNFDFSMFWQGSAGNKVANGIYHDLMIGQYINHHTDMLNFWTPTNKNTNIPRPIIGDPNQNARYADRFIENGAYVKLQNFQLGYTIPASVLERVKAVKSFRAYISGQNFLTISRYRGYDPDFMSDGLFSRGFDIGSFPNPRTLMFGIQVGL